MSESLEMTWPVSYFAICSTILHMQLSLVGDTTKVPEADGFWQDHDSDGEVEGRTKVHAVMHCVCCGQHWHGRGGCSANRDVNAVRNILMLLNRRHVYMDDRPRTFTRSRGMLSVPFNIVVPPLEVLRPVRGLIRWSLADCRPFTLACLRVWGVEAAETLLGKHVRGISAYSEISHCD